jgi:hypothetical protein
LSRPVFNTAAPLQFGIGVGKRLLRQGTECATYSSNTADGAKARKFIDCNIFTTVDAASPALPRVLDGGGGANKARKDEGDFAQYVEQLLT